MVKYVSEEGRYQIECRAIRTAVERSIGALLEAHKRSDEEHTRIAIKNSIDEIRKVLAIDFTCPEERNNYLVPGGTNWKK